MAKKRKSGKKNYSGLLFIVFLGFVAFTSSILYALYEEGALSSIGLHKKKTEQKIASNDKTSPTRNSISKNEKTKGKDHWNDTQKNSRLTDEPDDEATGDHTAQDQGKNTITSRNDNRTPAKEITPSPKPVVNSTMTASNSDKPVNSSKFASKREPDKNVSSTNKITAQKRQTQSEVEVTGKIAIVIDDFGNNWNTVDDFCSIDIPITLAVLPKLPYSAKAAAKASREGKEIILHLPMENHSNKNPGPGAVTVNMSKEQIQKEFEKDLADIPGAVGFNNHEGSKGTENEKLMEAVMEAAHKHNLYFVDSRTSSSSVALDVASRRNVPGTRRNVFLDNEDNVNAICAQLQLLADKAVKDGSAVGIGHCRPNTYKAIAKMIPTMKEKGIQFVFVSKLAR
jgi:polysaccharide deacetylase 2 family uncharacterized protein YibQ